MTAMASLALLYFLLWVGVAVSTPVDLQKRIYKGVPCDKTDRLYHVRLRATDGKRTSLCGGSLISDRWILTAAHCWDDSRTMYADVNFHPDEKKAKPIKIIDHVIPVDPNKKEHDIMLLKLESHSEKIHKIDLPDCSTDIKEDDKFKVSGYVHDVYPNNTKFLQAYNVLHCTDMTVVDCSSIKTGIQKCFPNHEYENFFCGKGVGVDMGGGDSGSGAVVGTKIYGVYNGSKDYACVAPVLFTRVCKYITWINNTIKSSETTKHS